MVLKRYQLIESSVKLLSLVKDLETGQRGYIVTGDTVFLEPYKKAKQIVQSETNNFNYLINENDPQANLLKEKINKIIYKKTTDIENSINIAKTYGQDSAARKVNTKVGKAYMDTLRILIEEVTQREKALLLEQTKKMDKSVEMNDSIRFFAFTLIGLTSVLALMALLKRERNIKELIESLKKSKEELEEKVFDRTKQLQETNQAKDHFLSIVSHDLKVPISGILGMIEIMNLENINRDEQEAEYLNYIKDSGLNMQRLISNLLDINTIEQGLTPLNKGEVDLGTVLSKLTMDFSHQAKSKGIELTVNILKEVIQTDQDMLSRILGNLLSNAIKFTHSGGYVQLKTSSMNGKIQFEIIDNGLGIPEEEIPKLFIKSQKLSNRPTGGEDSNGLGLSIVKELTILLGGKISLSSKVGQGTTFTLIVPS